MEFAQALGEFVTGLRYETLPTEVQNKLKTCFVNAISMGVAGSGLEATKMAVSMIKGNEAVGDNNAGATILMDGTRVPEASAAFVNSVMFNNRAQEDTYRSVHCGSVAVPVALALGESRRLTGKQVLEGVLAGYEVGCAVEEGLAPLTIPRGFRSSGLYGIMCATATAAKLMNLDAKQTANAIRIACSFAGGITEAFCFGTDEWFFQNGMSCHNGIMAAYLAAMDMQGAETAFMGKMGFMRAYAGVQDESLLDIGLAGLGKDFRIMKVNFKVHPSCAYCQTPIVLTLDMVKEFGFKADEIEKIDYYMTPLEANGPGMKLQGPFETPTQANMSGPFNIAQVLVTGTCTKAGMRVLDSEKINSLAKRITIINDETLPIISGRMRVQLKDGRLLEKDMVVDRDYYSLNWEENARMIHDVFRELGMADERAVELLDFVSRMETAPDIRPILELTGKR